VFLLDPDDPRGTEKPGEVIMGSGDGSRGRALLMGYGGKAPPPKRGSRAEPQKLKRF